MAFCRDGVIVRLFLFLFLIRHPGDCRLRPVDDIMSSFLIEGSLKREQHHISRLSITYVMDNAPLFAR